MLRCARCRLVFEPSTPGLPPCPQCGGAAALLLRIEPTRDESDAPTTLKFRTERRDATG